MPIDFRHARFRKRFRAVMEQEGSRKALERNAELVPSAVSAWLRPDPNKALPNGQTLVRLAEKTGVSLDWLLFGVGPEKLGATRTHAELGEELGRHLRAEVVRRCGRHAEALDFSLAWVEEQAVARAEEAIHRGEEIELLLDSDPVKAFNLWLNTFGMQREGDPSWQDRTRDALRTLPPRMRALWTKTPAQRALLSREEE